MRLAARFRSTWLNTDRSLRVRPPVSFNVNARGPLRERATGRSYHRRERLPTSFSVAPARDRRTRFHARFPGYDPLSPYDQGITMTDRVPASRSRRLTANIVDGALISTVACAVGALDRLYGFSLQEDPRARRLVSRLSEAAWDALSIQRQRGNSPGFRAANVSAVDAATFKQLSLAQAVLRVALKRAPALISTELTFAETHRLRVASAASRAALKAERKAYSKADSYRKTRAEAAIKEQLRAAVPLLGKSLLLMYATKRLLQPLRARAGTKTVAVNR